MPKTPLRLMALLMVAGLATLVAQDAVALDDGGDDDHRLSVSLGVDLRPEPESGGHGYVMVLYEARGLPNEARVNAYYNTDTVYVGYDHHKLSETVYVGGFLKGQYVFAGLMPDYYRLGLRMPERGFQASYAQGEVHLEHHPADHLTARFRLSARRWFFGPTAQTDPAFDLPPETWQFRPSLSFVYWDIEGDPSIQDWWRPYWRVRGLTVGAELAYIFRPGAEPWGARDPQAFDPVDPRNDPSTLMRSLRQWLTYGRQIDRDMRVQLSQRAAWTLGEESEPGIDDLVRDRIGGLNTYVVPLAGLPWAAYSSGRYLAFQQSFHYWLGGPFEAGLFLDTALLPDIRRVGNVDDWNAIAGVGSFINAQFDRWQFDVRGGWAPDLPWFADAPHFSVFMAVGTQVM